MDKVHCLNCKKPLYISDDIMAGILYLMKCNVCGHDHKFSIRVTDRRKWFKPLECERLGGSVPLETKVPAGFPHREPNYKGKLTSGHLFTRENNPVDADRRVLILYEALADGDITEDQFNRFILRS